MTRAEPLRVLFVCTGNVCRSPVAEWALLDAVAVSGGTLPLTTASAGHAARPGSPADAAAERAARAAGILPRPHAARRLDAAQIIAADLVLGLDREARGAVVRFVPRAAATAFTLVEFVRLLPYVDPAVLVGSPAALVAAVAAARGCPPPPSDPRDDDIPDPYGRPDALHQDVVARIRSAVEGLAAARRLPAGAPS